MLKETYTDVGYLKDEESKLKHLKALDKRVYRLAKGIEKVKNHSTDDNAILKSCIRLGKNMENDIENLETGIKEWHKKKGLDSLVKVAVVSFLIFGTLLLSPRITGMTVIENGYTISNGIGLILLFFGIAGLLLMYKKIQK